MQCKSVKIWRVTFTKGTLDQGICVRDIDCALQYNLLYSVGGPGARIAEALLSLHKFF